MTIKDVAKEANVSVATVSRVINNNYPVNERTRKTVLGAIEKLGYKPNAVARGLKKKETFLIGMVTPDISNPFYMEIAKGIESVVADEGYNLVFCSSDEKIDKELQMLGMLHEKQVDAVILASRQVEQQAINKLIEEGMTVVLIDSKIEGVEADLIIENGYDAAVEALEGAVKKGHHKIAIINGNLEVSTGRSRYKAYLDVLTKYGIKANVDYEISGEFSREVAYIETKKMLKANKDNLPTLIFGANNYMTEGALIAMKEQGLKIKEDISIISFGEITIPELVEPRLTVIEQNSYQIGKNAGKLLMGRLKQLVDKNRFKTIELQLGVREGDSVKILDE